MRNPRHVGVPSELTIVIKLGTSSIVNEATCTVCGECVGTCPGDAITLGAAQSGAAS